MKGPGIVVGAVVAIVLLFSSVYTISETEQVILTQFGRPVGGGPVMLLCKSSRQWRSVFEEAVEVAG